MRNLELIQCTHKGSDDTFFQAEWFTHSSGSIYYISKKSLCKFELNDASITELCPDLFDDVVSIKFLNIESKICVVTCDMLYIIEPDGNKVVKVTPVTEKIDAISWNSSEELVAVVTLNGSVSTFTVDYENGNYFHQGTSSLNSKIPDTVYVGWGSKDTQFQGSGGKLTTKEVVTMAPIQDKHPQISWRGNGEMFVVNYWRENKREFVVFDATCKALFRSEKCPGLQAMVAWRPTGNMIATISQISDKQSVVVFEKNGQKRFSFDLDFNHVKEIKWSPCAQILMLYSTNINNNSQTLHLLSSSNYLWYEKQTLVFNSDNPLLYYEWLETTQFTFTLRTITKKKIIDYMFRRSIHNFEANCAVINGKNLQITNFGDAVIPPTMFGNKITSSDPINFIFLNASKLATVDSQNCLRIFEVCTLSLKHTFHLDDLVKEQFSYPLPFHNFLFKEEHIYFASSDTKFYKLQPVTGELMVLCEPQSMSWTSSVSNSFHHVSKFVEQQCYHFDLTSNCHLYVNGCKIYDSVSSFIIFENYLLFTTKLNELHCLRLAKEILGHFLAGNSNCYRRNIEQGATIVTAIPNSSRIVLQLPRGNLETISCRLISIDILDRLLTAEKWGEALRFIRLEKLNANLLFDLNPGRFLQQINRFVSEFRTINELNSVILEFQRGNVLNTLHQNCRKTEVYPDKIAALFGTLLAYFDEIDYVAYINTVMIINLQFYTVRDALIYVQDLLRRSMDNFDLKKNVNQAINTLKTYGCDQEKLYRESLLLYDLNLARYVANCCQMDPRIFEPHLDNLKNMSEIQRRYAINIYCKQPKMAIYYLLRCPGIKPDEISSFIRTHNLSREAYQGCNLNSPYFQLISCAFAENLSVKKCHHEAGVVLKKAHLLEEAVEEFKLGLKWREVLDLIQELQVGETERLKIVIDLAERLVQCHEVKDAAILYEFYAHNYEMAIKILIENSYFKDALHATKKYNRKDIIVSEIIPALNKHKSDLSERLSELHQLFLKHKTRLTQVRQIKAAKFASPTYEDVDDRDGGDLFSDAGSIITTSTRSSRSRSSTASSRSRRKEEKKKQNLREGGVYEDIALVRALHCTITEIYSKGEDVNSCCLLLLQESNTTYKQIKAFYELYVSIRKEINESLLEIWPPHFVNNNIKTQDIRELADLENFEHLDVDFRTPPSGRGDNWGLSIFHFT